MGVLTNLEAIPRLGTFTTRGLAGGDAQRLGGKTHGALDLELLRLGARDQLLAH